MKQSTLKKSLVLAAAFAVSASAIDAPIYGKCGGGSYEAKCPTGYKCEVVNPHYSQCVPIKYTDPKEPRDLYVAETSHIEKRAVPAVFDPVVGADSCSCQPRRKIQTLQASYPTVFNMFILALQSLQQTPENQAISWFQIAGIHGRPYAFWQQDPLDPYTPKLGYCTHASRLFTTWHRPYLVLLEQSLYRRAKQISAQFTGQSYSTYSAAAEQVRLPYWDWAELTTGGCLPAVVMQSTISVTRPGTAGVPQTVTIANPLFQYNFQSTATLATHFENYFAQWTYTRRRPGPLSGGGISNNAAACSAMGSGLTTRRSQTYTALNQALFNNFSNQLEIIHGTVHTLVGGSNPSGHMTTIDYSAFDPIFWLHHCNVDRLLAMYQATHSNYLTPGPAMATWGRVVPGVDGPLDNLNTNLYPFRKTTGLYWKSEDVKLASSIWKFKYGYDEVPCSYASQPDTTLATYTRKRINSLYGPKIISGPFTPVRDIFIRDDFSIRAVIDASEIPGSWTLHAFLGKPEAKPADYETSPYRIASISAFGNPGERKNSYISDNQIMISDSIYERKEVEYQKDTIIKYLTSNLYWAITTDDDEIKEIPIESLKSFKIGVYTAPGNYTNPDQETDYTPVYGTPVYVPECTRGKPGGIQSDKDILYPTLLNGTRVDLTAYYQ